MDFHSLFVMVSVSVVSSAVLSLDLWAPPTVFQW